MAAVGGLVALPSLAGATSRLTATNVRIGDHAAFVRVVVDFNGTLPQRQVEFDELRGTMAVLHIAHPGLTSQVAVRSGDGVRVALQSGGQQLHIAATFTRHRFKYVSYTVVTGNRLAIDLWKSDPRSVAAEIRNAGCLGLSSWHVRKGSVSAQGTERGLFEHTFQVVVRGASGAVLGRRTVVHGRTWSAPVRYTASHRQTGMLEAVAFSPKDGALSCIAQVHVALPAS
jgi:immunoglobulin-like protein involved in spore germination